MKKRKLRTPFHNVAMARALTEAGIEPSPKPKPKPVEFCPIHHQRTKPCKACEDAYRAAKEQQITQNRADANQAHQEWLKAQHDQISAKPPERTKQG